MKFLHLLVPALLAGTLGGLVEAAPAKPAYQSPLVTPTTPGHAVEISADIADAKKLWLVVTDGGNGFGCDWADWAEPRLIGEGGEKKLTELKWTKSASGFGSVQVNKNCGGAPLRINNKPVEYGIGTHANSVIEFDLPTGFTTFKARGGLDNGGTDQGGCGAGASVQFLVFTSQPAAQYLQASTNAPSDLGKREPADALAGLTVHEDLEATVFAAEPMLLSPTNIDVDHLGRVWVCECVNYRGRNGERPEGDRILVLEDTDGDGQADKQTVFHQGRDIDSALGICVLGNKVIVSVAPNVFIFTDENGDLKADKRETLFTNVGQPQHDHSAHAFLFGPDGKLYWNFGNTGQQVHDKDGKIVTSVAGYEVKDNRQPYSQGMPFRCNLDGSEFEVLGWNFRNNYEVTVDSFGTLWQSDNDDDGNRGVRINFVMEFGNFGYTDEMTGAGWKTERVNMEQEIPHQHWHLNDPGVVPNLIQTGAGSPTGICVYEGELLPKAFHGQVIHCDAGPNIVRAYPARVAGAGYTAEMLNILEGTQDKWFRPSDVCVAPDGSLIIADWYDPGVGGHRMGDVDRGRLFRVAPPGTKYTMPKYDFSTPAGAVEALKSPNLSARYLAWTALNQWQEKAETELLKLAQSDNPRYQARAIWLLGNIKDRGQKTVDEALQSKNSDIRITGLRLARRLKLDLVPVLQKLVKDPSPAVRRECAVALCTMSGDAVPGLWATLAAQHDGQDRWYLEALGIGARNQWDACLAAYMKAVNGKWNTPAGRDIVWRSRAAATPTLLAQLLCDPETAAAELPRYLRALDFQTGDTRQQSLVQLAFGTEHLDEARQTLIVKEALARLKGFDLNNPQQRTALMTVLDRLKGTSQFVALVARFDVKDRYPELLQLAQSQPEGQLGSEAIRALLQKKQTELILAAVNGENREQAENTVIALGTSQDNDIVHLLLPLIRQADASIGVRRQSVRAIAQTKNGATRLLELVKQNQVDPNLKEAVAAALHTSSLPEIKQEAEKLFPLPPGRDNEKLPPLENLLAMKGDIGRGRYLFNTTATCAKCHIVDEMGKEVGPNLSGIGKKLSRKAMFESVLYPSAGISHNYETYSVVLLDGNQVNGIIISQDAESISLKGADAIVRTFKKSEVDEMAKQDVSLMPADLQKVMSTQELVDVVEYMTTLQKDMAPTEPASK